MKETDWDLIIIGAGFAGLSAAQYGARANLRTLLIESNAPGGQILLVDDLENYPGVPGPVSGIDISENMEEQARDFGATVKSANVSEIIHEADGTYTVKTRKDNFSTLAVITTSGADHRKLGVAGEEEFVGKGVSYCATCDGPFFKDKKILVVGGGDAACDEAIYLAKLTDTVVLAHRRDVLRAQKAVATRALGHEHIEPRLFTVVKEIKGEGKVQSIVLQNVQTGEEYEEAFDAIFIFVGSDPNVSFLPKEVACDNAGHIITNEKMETNLAGFFAAGDVRVSPFRQLVVAASDGAIAAHYTSHYIDSLS